MSTPSHAPGPEFIAAYTAMMLNGVTRELEITKKVIAAIPDANRGHRPDPHARTAWELACHIADVDVHFLDSIADLKFAREDPRRAENCANVTELVAWYDREMKRAAERVRQLSPAQLATPVDFLGVFNLPAAFYLGFLSNHSIHHRGELATYLRPMGSKVPSIYGGSYDEPFRMPEPESAAA